MNSIRFYLTLLDLTCFVFSFDLTFLELTWQMIMIIRISKMTSLDLNLFISVLMSYHPIICVHPLSLPHYLYLSLYLSFSLSLSSLSFSLSLSSLSQSLSSLSLFPVLSLSLSLSLSIYFYSHSLFLSHSFSFLDVSHHVWYTWTRLTQYSAAEKTVTTLPTGPLLLWKPLWCRCGERMYEWEIDERGGKKVWAKKGESSC